MILYPGLEHLRSSMIPVKLATSVKETLFCGRMATAIALPPLGLVRKVCGWSLMIFSMESLALNVRNQSVQKEFGFLSFAHALAMMLLVNLQDLVKRMRRS